MHGMHFDTDKTFMKPDAITGIRMLIKLYTSYPGLSSVLVNGHTDKQGTVDYNRGLSRERADSIEAYLTDKSAVWMKWYAGMPSSKRWGNTEDQYMLSTLVDKGTGKEFLQPPRSAGQSAKDTGDAIKAFQKA